MGPAATMVVASWLAAAPPSNVEPDPRERDAIATRRCGAWQLSCCPPGPGPCTRARAARLLLLSLGALASGAAAMSLFVFGDRVAGNDPSTLLFGTGALAGVGTLLGALAGRLGNDRPGRSDHIRPVTFGLRWDPSGSTIRGESIPHTLSGTFAPNLRFRDDDGRVRLFGRIGGDLGTREDIDPRPQVAGPDGEAPLARRSRGLDIDLGLDWAVSLPYPLSRRSPRLGRAEIRWRPEVRIRRDVLSFAGAEARTIERTMLLPLTVGVRWHVSPRQRFTIYFGPRFDFVAYGVGGDRLHRGRGVPGPFYGEAWYDLHMPLQKRADPRVRLQGLLSLGYVHGRFDGQGFNFGSVIGFLGPVVAQWSMRLRPRRSDVAYQGMIMGTAGNGFSLSFTTGVVLPDLRARGRG